MNISNLKILFLVCIFFFFSCSLTVDQKIDEILSDYSGNVPGASLIVIKSGKPLFKKTFGMADLQKGVKVSSKTNFRLASVTKQFTAMCIMMLVERKQLKYSDTLSDIFKNYPDYGKEITLTHLLQHSSGLIAYENILADSVTKQVLDKDILEMMMGQDSTYYQSGSKYRYSNSGYALLAMIIEKKSGKSFAQFLNENIFVPLKMDNSVAYENGVSTIKNRAFGYAIDESEEIKTNNFIFKDQSRTSAVLGDGGIYSSINDLFKWDQALYADKLVSKETLAKAWSAGIIPDSPDNIYGFGWRIDQFEGHKRVHHNGSTSGFRNTLQRFPDDSLTVILLTNRAEPNVAPFVEEIARLFLD